MVPPLWSNAVDFVSSSGPSARKQQSDGGALVAWNSSDGFSKLESCSKPILLSSDFEGCLARFESVPCAKFAASLAGSVCLVLNSYELSPLCWLALGLIQIRVGHRLVVSCWSLKATRAWCDFSEAST